MSGLFFYIPYIQNPGNHIDLEMKMNVYLHLLIRKQRRCPRRDSPAADQGTEKFCNNNSARRAPEGP